MVLEVAILEVKEKNVASLL